MKDTTEIIKTEKDSLTLIFINKIHKYLIIIMIIGLLGGAFVFLLKPKYQEIKNNINDIIPKRQKRLEDLEAYYGKLRILVSNLNKYKEDNSIALQKMKNALPNKPHIDELFAQIDALTKEAGFTLGSINFTEPTLVSDGRTLSEQQVTYSSSNKPVGISGAKAAAADGQAAAGDTDSQALAANKDLGSDAPAKITPKTTVNNYDTGSEIGVVNFTINVTGGGYDKFKELLSSFERHLRLMDVVSVAFGDNYKPSCRRTSN